MTNTVFEQKVHHHHHDQQQQQQQNKRANITFLPETGIEPVISRITVQCAISFF